MKIIADCKIDIKHGDDLIFKKGSRYEGDLYEQVDIYALKDNFGTLIELPGGSFFNTHFKTIQRGLEVFHYDA